MTIALPPISEGDKTPLVLSLLEIIQQLTTEVQQLKDEIARLKGHKTRPEIRPSILEAKPTGTKTPADNPGKRPGSAKRRKTTHLQIQETLPMRPANLPAGSRREGCQRYVVQDLRLVLHNTCYLLERWRTPDGQFLVGQLPPGVRTLGHFGLGLRTLVLYQHTAQQVPQPRILALVRAAGVDISAGQLNRLLTEKHDGFHVEKDELLAAGLAVSPYIQADDTAARHRGQNGYTTHIGNAYFAWFATTESKSRINFLQLLRGGASDYHLTAEAFTWMEQQGLGQDVIRRLHQASVRLCVDEPAWRRHLADVGVADERHCRIATEAALLGSALEHGLRPDVVVVSDDAGQFDVWLHALCWVHAERNLNKLVPVSDRQQADLAAVRTELWQLYQDLKAYKARPEPQQKASLQARFDALCLRPGCSGNLAQALKRLHHNKAELLLVLERPELPLHNNLSEQDIRDYVTKRKISGGTRSALGRRCRDTFMSLHKTCRKLGVSFWAYLQDRLGGLGQIPPLGELLRRKASGAAAAAEAVCLSPQPNSAPEFVLV